MEEHSTHGVETRSQLDNTLVDFIELLQSININAPLARLNETTIADNNGSRIEL